ncbi:xanthine/CO dehydrogenase XdhC/CoxF family maturation factor [Hamadaea flava]|uniref:XdhC family protein n=1 Tax=Hamadaea flava TaxID=1742688 RepID=A0ABV8LUF1_9ACTN|nr:XdhC family protein [Hamadaea flava]MCP2327486.1 xanthine/CO dehydrogenase XdhC/CoxF family maturation factor [Hamadaea flava]
MTSLACDLAQGVIPAESGDRTLVAVFATPVAEFLLHFGQDLGYRTVLVEPDLTRIGGTHRLASSVDPSFADLTADIVVTDHDRPELGAILKAALDTPARWIGVMGSVHHVAQHVAALTELGVDPAQIARVRRPIGLNIGSKAPAEIAVSTLAGLIADRNGRPGGFTF